MPDGRLGEPQPAHQLPAWAQATRDTLDRFDHKYFGGYAGPWIWQADSHEIVDMTEEFRWLPDECLEADPLDEEF